MKIIFREDFSRGGYSLWIIERRNDSNYCAKPIELMFEEKGNGAWQLPEPTLRFDDESMSNQFLQGLSNALTEIGFRPNTDRQAGELEGTKKHLEDMRKLVFEKLT